MQAYEIDLMEKIDQTDGEKWRLSCFDEGYKARIVDIFSCQMTMIENEFFD